MLIKINVWLFYGFTGVYAIKKHKKTLKISYIKKYISLFSPLFFSLQQILHFDLNNALKPVFLDDTHKEFRLITEH